MKTKLTYNQKRLRHNKRMREYNKANRKAVSETWKRWRLKNKKKWAAYVSERNSDPKVKAKNAAYQRRYYAKHGRSNKQKNK
jgi:hypothetical protein